MIDLNLITDILLILISGSACIYCIKLNNRLKKLNDLETGVGASIVELTEAIAQTHQAAREAKQATTDTTDTLETLLKRADIAMPKIEALIIEMERAEKLARKTAETRVGPAAERAEDVLGKLTVALQKVETLKKLQKSFGTVAQSSPHTVSQSATSEFERLAS